MDKRIDIDVSVIVPVYNVEKYLPHALECIMNQTYSNYEVICVDDSSTDESYNILLQYQKKYSNMKVIRNSENVGLAETRNVGLASAIGEYVLFLDSDDVFEKTLIQKLFSKCKKEDADVVVYYTGHFINGSKKKFIPDRKGINEVYINTYPVMHSSDKPIYIYELITNSAFDKLVRRKYLIDSQIRFQRYPYTEDMGYSYEIIMGAAKVVFLNKVMYFHRREREGSLSQHLFNKKSYLIEVLRDIHLFEKNRGISKISEKAFWEFALHRIYQSMHTISEQYHEDLVSNAHKFLTEYFLPFHTCFQQNSLLSEKLWNCILHDDVSKEYSEILRESQRESWEKSKRKMLVAINNLFAGCLFKRDKLTDYYINTELLTYRQICIASRNLLLSKLRNTIINLG